MPATVRYDEQYCPIARALDQLGDRWTLLILRELLVGERRFTDLRAGLPGVTPAVLTARLRTLLGDGLVMTVEGDAGRRGYAITARGRETIPVMRALARFGMPLLEDPETAPSVRPWSAVQTCVLPYYDRQAAEGVDERYRFRVDGFEQVVSTVRGGGRPIEPVLDIGCRAATLFAIRRGQIGFDEAVDRGQVTVDGSEHALANFRRIFHVA